MRAFFWKIGQAVDIDVVEDSRGVPFGRNPYKLRKPDLFLPMLGPKPRRNVQDLISAGAGTRTSPLTRSAAPPVSRYLLTRSLTDIDKLHCQQFGRIRDTDQVSLCYRSLDERLAFWVTAISADWTVRSPSNREVTIVTSEKCRRVGMINPGQAVLFPRAGGAAPQHHVEGEIDRSPDRQ